MTNETFTLLSEEEKNKKLKTVLKRKSGNCLTDNEISIITAYLSLNRQYLIRVYREPTKFITAMAASCNFESRTLLGKIFAGEDDLSMTVFCEQDVAAVITKVKQDGNPLYCIHIYIPSSREE